MDDPDYTNYSLHELEDTLAHIDKDAFPERTALIQQEIASRQNEYAEKQTAFVPLVEELHPNWFIRYWRGQVSLPMSYWVVGFATTFLIYFITFIAHKGIEGSTSTWHLGLYVLGLYAFIFAAVTWQSVGLFRTARKHPLRTNDTGWASVALVMLGLGLMSFTFSMYKTGLPIIKGGFQLLVGSDNWSDTQFRVLNEGKDLELIGHIEIGANELLKEQLALNPDIERIHLHSQGGRLLAAQRMMKTIKEHDLVTYVKTECASACTLLYLAGTNRLLAEAGKLQFHAPGVGGTSTHDNEELASGMIGAYKDAGLPKWFVNKVMSTPHETLWEPTHKELLQAKIVNEVVDSGLYPMSGLGSHSEITGESIEAGLLSLDYMVAMKQFDPEAYQKAIDINLKGMLTGKSKNEITGEFQELLYTERLPVYLSKSSDESIVQYWRLQIAHMKSLRSDFPLACASFTYPEEVPEKNRYGNEGTISPEQQANEQNAIAALIRTWQDTQVSIDTETQQALIQDVLSNLSEQNEEFIKVASSPTDYISQPTLLCDASIALNEAFLSFDVTTSGQLLRSL